VTIRTLQRTRERGERFACLTCYDATTARWLERAGVPVLLVGDTAAEVILGLPGTIHAPLDFMVTVTAAVKRGAPLAMVMADMPFMSYQADEREALHNAARFLVEGHADTVKLEVDRTFAPLVARMSRAGVAVVAHLGSRPQQTKRRGGYLSSGRTAGDAAAIMEDARAMEDAGASMLLLEAMPAEVAERIVARSALPVIGCGAGPACHGQVVVLQDILGLTDWQPAFAQPLARGGAALIEAAGAWVDRVRRNDLGEHPYRISAEELISLDRACHRPSSAPASTT
jgi:3-methyl-2-oxobutanoate hydroxymethyltransferase